MIGKANRRFWKHFDALPPNVQKLAREKYALWKSDPHHPSLLRGTAQWHLCGAYRRNPKSIVTSPITRKATTRKPKTRLGWP